MSASKHPFLVVLASGSGGNCSALVLPAKTESALERRIWLIDAGYSPRTTRSALARVGLDMANVAGLILTHLDTDHYYPGWASTLPRYTRCVVHRVHRPGRETVPLPKHTEAIDGDFELAPGVRVSPCIVPHDEVGTCAFRFGFACGASLGFATDLGEASVEFTTHMTGVDVMAIESNYCRGLQLASSRPEALKGRIMGGRGHLSNEDAMQALRAIRPKRHVVLLHLSRECNQPRLVTRLHERRGYQFTVTSQFAPSPRVLIEATPPDVPAPDMRRVRQVLLPFGRVSHGDAPRPGLTPTCSVS